MHPTHRSIASSTQPNDQRHTPRLASIDQSNRSVISQPITTTAPRAPGLPLRSRTSSELSSCCSPHCGRCCFERRDERGTRAQPVSSARQVRSVVRRRPWKRWRDRPTEAIQNHKGWQRTTAELRCTPRDVNQIRSYNSTATARTRREERSDAPKSWPRERSSRRFLRNPNFCEVGTLLD